MSKMGQLADAVAAVLNQDPAPVALGVSAVATWRASWTTSQLGDLKVAVVPGPAEYRWTTRNTLTGVFATDIVLAKQVAPEIKSQPDAIAALAEAVAQHFATTYASTHLVDGALEAKLDDPPAFVGPDQAAIDSRLLTESRVALFVLRLIWWV